MQNILYVIAAFSSDAIPVHLLTREAMANYLRKLNRHGMVVMHVTNRHLELASVVAGIAAENGLLARVSDTRDPSQISNPFKYGGTVVAVARSDKDFGKLTRAAGWNPKASDLAQRIWTDDYSNIVGAVIRKLNE